MEEKPKSRDMAIYAEIQYYLELNDGGIRQYPEDFSKLAASRAAKSGHPVTQDDVKSLWDYLVKADRTERELVIELPDEVKETYLHLPKSDRKKLAKFSAVEVYCMLIKDPKDRPAIVDEKAEQAKRAKELCKKIGTEETIKYLAGLPEAPELDQEKVKQILQGDTKLCGAFTHNNRAILAEVPDIDWNQLRELENEGLITICTYEPDIYIPDEKTGKKRKVNGFRISYAEPVNRAKKLPEPKSEEPGVYENPDMWKDVKEEQEKNGEK